MSLKRIRLEDYEEKISRHVIINFKKVIELFKSSSRQTKLLFILGSGRSGTSMMTDVFMRDLRIDSLAEDDPRVANKNYMLNLERIKPTIMASKYEHIVIKPILNSFKCAHLLDFVEGSKAIWMFRNYKDVVLSSLELFGDLVAGYLKKLVETNQGNNWIGQGIHQDTIEMIRKMDFQSFSKVDWMSLVWWSVNRTIVIDGPTKRKELLLIQYEDLVRHPVKYLQRIYEHIGLNYKSNAHKYIHSRSIGRGKELLVEANIAELCDSLFGKLISLKPS